MSLKWFRLHHEIISNEKVSLLSKEDRWHYISILCLKASGVIDNPKYQGELFDRILCMQLDLDREELHALHQELLDLHLIDENWHPIGWDAKQYKSDTSTERVKKHRLGKMKRFSNVSETACNVSVTPPDTDTDTDTDTENNKNTCVKPKGSTRNGYTKAYTRLWDAYPLKRGKKPGFTVFQRKKLESKTDDLIADIENRKRNDKQWIDGFVPHLSTYLNQERWEDEIKPTQGANHDIYD